MLTRADSRKYGPVEMSVLQKCFDSLVLKHSLDRQSRDAELIAQALFKAYDQGVIEPLDLMALADFDSLPPAPRPE